MKRILIIVDPQNDFITGSLAVPGAEEAMEKFRQSAWNGDIEKYDFIAVTIDNHPQSHCSFVQQGGIFPPHCVNHTIGAAISPVVENALKFAKNFGNNVKFYTKGENPNTEEFSIFKSPNSTKLLLDISEFCTVDDFEIHVMGIAGDYCVHDTIADIIELTKDFNTPFKDKIVVLYEFIASLDGGLKLHKLILEHKLQTLYK